MNIMQRIIKQSGSAGEADHAYLPDWDWYLDVRVRGTCTSNTG